MKLITLLLSLVASITAYADCRIYVQIDSVLKESERALTIDLTTKHLKELGHSVTPFLNKTDAVLKVFLNPVLVDGGFLYQATLVLMQTNGVTHKSISQDLSIATTFKKALEAIPVCR